MFVVDVDMDVLSTPPQGISVNYSVAGFWPVCITEISDTTTTGSGRLTSGTMVTMIAVAGIDPRRCRKNTKRISCCFV